MATQRALSIEDTNLSSISLAATRNREYSDLDFAFNKKPTSGEIYKKTNAAAVKQAVKNLLMTNRNEKPFQPYYGGDLNNFLFELSDENSQSDIEENIKEQIRVFEPRVDLSTLKVSANVQPDYNSLEVTVVFRVVNTNETVEFTTVLNRLR